VSLVVVQMGHCFRRKGATGTAGEQLFSKRAADACQRVLSERGHLVRAIRADDPEGAYRGDVFVALHCDGSTDPAAHGASAGYRSSAGRRLARAFLHAYAAQGWHGFRPDNYTDALKGYYGLRVARDQGARYAFVVQAGFLTHDGDRAALTSALGPERVATALGNALESVLAGRTLQP